MENPLVSVIIPNYNHGRFLKNRIDSILNQTYTNFEIILLDDCSNDNSVDIIKTYKNNPHISRIIINQENSGSPFLQWKKGIGLAQGDLIWIAESDDTCEANLLETLIKEFESDTYCVLAYCKSIKIDAEGRKLCEEGFSSSFNMNGRLFIHKHLCRHNYIVNASSTLFKRNAALDIDWSFTKYRGCGDWIFWIEICRKGNIAYCSIPFNHFRIHGTNTTMQQTFDGRNEIEGMRVYRYMREKEYISYKNEYRARLSHIYSITYGKQKAFYSKEKKKELLKAWRINPFIKVLIFFIYVVQKNTNIQIIKR